MRRIIVGKSYNNKNVYYDNRCITFPVDWKEHKFILDTFGVYCQFYPSRSGFSQYVICHFPIEKKGIAMTLEKLKKIQKKLRLKIFDYPKIKKKIDELILESI